MYVKRFYREDGAERKREYRQRRATTELLSNFSKIQSDLTDDEDITDSAMNMSPTNSNLLQQTATDNDPFGAFSRSNDRPQVNDSKGSEAGCGEDDGGDDGGDGGGNDSGDDDDNEYVEELLNLFDTNRDRKLYPSCALSIYEACLELIKISRDLNVNKLQMNRLLNGIRLLLPSDSKLPRTVPGLLKVASKAQSL